MPKANDRQVGGLHYKHDYQHWDWVAEIGMGYLDGTASKYLCRWKDKGGLQDLEKGLHYVEKLEEESRKPNRKLNAGRASDDIIWSATLRVCRGHDMSWDQMDIMFCLATWKSPKDLLDIISLYSAYIEKMREQPLVNKTAAKPVPLTEENHHAQREDQADEDFLPEAGPAIGDYVGDETLKEHFKDDALKKFPFPRAQPRAVGPASSDGQTDS